MLHVIFRLCPELSEAPGPVQTATAVALLTLVSRVWLAGHWMVGSSISVTNRGRTL